MPRPISVPKLCFHKASGKAVVRLNGRDHYLGVYGSTEAKGEYDRLIAEWLAAGRRDPEVVAKTATSKPVPISVNEVLLAFLTWAPTYYKDVDGEPTTEVGELKSSVRPVCDLYGLTPAAEFGPLALDAVRQHMIGRGWCRTLINRRVERVKRVFKWAASKELIPAAVEAALRTVPGLQKGRTAARESDPVTPVDPHHVEACLPHLNPHVRAMVELQRHTGMRPGEVCGLSFAEVDRTDGVWVYRPSRHKTAHRGKERVVFIGPKGRAVLEHFVRGDHPPPEGFEYLDLNAPANRDARLVAADAYQEAGREHDAALLRDVGRAVVLVAGCVVDPTAKLFSPERERVERFRRRRAARKSKVPPSQLRRRKTSPKRLPAAEYHPHAYANAVAKSCVKAGVPRWFPNQLRHSFATDVRKDHGLEAAQHLLGHSHANVTQIYADRDLQMAAQVAAKIG